MKDPAPRVLYVKESVNMKDTGPYKEQTFCREKLKQTLKPTNSVISSTNQCHEGK